MTADGQVHPEHVEIDLAGFSDVTELLGPRAEYDPRTYLSIMLKPSMMALALTFAFPRFVEHRGAVLLESAYDEEAVEAWFQQLDGDAVAVELVMNHIHLWDVFAPSTAFEAETELLLAPLATSWGAALRAAFPTRTFRVLTDPDGDYGPELTFHSLTAEASGSG
ncbi:hypothetical protein [Pimelobacter simplex]|uniref:hypothetical protein n=1 Tax=Nocardioides simplex TaxID=2045 RepID=UPI00214F8E6C|nr:hypothetical protein [Pimelobacter simplex]UUW92467.1 hypothetical protein M0M43_13565 [Pimelobacter simplex]UUW96295.1 hypothetical protein M0M48_02200 [Pimelobacter simplex]